MQSVSSFEKSFFSLIQRCTHYVRPLFLLKKTFFGRCILCCNPTQHQLLPQGNTLVCPSCVTHILQPCIHSIQSPFAAYGWNTLFAFTLYQNPFKQLIFQYKYRSVLCYASLFADAIALALHPLSTQYDCIIPMPLFHKKLALRGFNQVLLIAKHLSKILHIPCDFTTLSATRLRSSQQKNKRYERSLGMHNLFIATNELKGKRVLLLDDIVTTGITLTHACIALVNAGASVDCAAIAVHKKGINTHCIDASFA